MTLATVTAEIAGEADAHGGARCVEARLSGARDVAVG